jgi:hypothetical protein
MEVVMFTELISRKEALERGLKRYFTGKECPHGHITVRHTVNGACIGCVAAYKAGRTASGVAREYQATKRREAGCRVTPRLPRDPAEREEALQERRRASYARNLGLFKAHARARKERYRRATPPWVTARAVKDIYAACPEGHHVDHIVPLKHKLVCGLHVPENLQHLPAADNLAKSNKFDPMTYDWWPEGVPRPVDA